MSSVSDFVIQDGHLLKYLGNDTQVTVPDGATDIHMDPFRGNANLRKVVLPDSVSAIHICAFENCTNLEEIVMPEGYVDIHPTAFKGCSKLADQNGLVIYHNKVYEYFGSGGNIVIPEGVTDVGCVFSENRSITSVTLPRSMGQYDTEHYRCLLNDKVTQWMLDRVRMGMAVMDITVLKTGAFANCTNLETVHLPEGIKWIPNYCFAGCSRLKQLNLPDSVEGMDINAVDGCRSLKRITGRNVKKIREAIMENPLCNGVATVMVCPQMPLDGVYKSVLKTSLILGFFQNQTLYDPEIAQSYKKAACRDRKYLMRSVFQEDIPEALAFYDQNKKIKPKDFEKEWMEPAQQYNAVQCIAWLLDWRSRHSPRKDFLSLE